MVAPSSVKVPVQPDMTKMYEGLALFYDAMADGHRRQAETCSQAAERLRRTAAMVKQEPPAPTPLMNDDQDRDA